MTKPKAGYPSHRRTSPGMKRAANRADCRRPEPLSEPESEGDAVEARESRSLISERIDRYGLAGVALLSSISLIMTRRSAQGDGGADVNAVTATIDAAITRN
jgi:hypothetical protein